MSLDNQIIFGIIFFVLIFLIYIFIEPYRIKVEVVNIKLKDVPIEFKKKVIVQISDIHFKNCSSKTKKIIYMIKKLNPDYLFITGDFIDEKAKNLEDFKSFTYKLSKLSKYPPIMVLGNHDYKNKMKDKFLEVIKKAGIVVLRNEAMEINRNVIVLGVDDPHTGHDDLEMLRQYLETTKPKIVLAHSPEIFRKLDTHNALVLCGHTHGGQINLPFFSRFIIPLKYDKQYVRGLFYERNLYMYVNRGIGETLLPIRFRSLPEITMIYFQ